jgi:ABC-type multidrug transport system ATPase subunit
LTRRAEVIAADSIALTLGGRRILSGATLAAHTGEIVGLLGRNGCGKTTLLRVLTGDARAQSGFVRVDGQRIHRPRLHRLARVGVFLLPERGLLGPLATVGQHMDHLALRFGADPAPAIESLRVRDLLDRLPAQLSTGERRRSELALALTRAPSCLIADEPLRGIAPRDVDILLCALRDLAATGCAVLLTGHEVPSVLEIADTIVWMSGGTTHTLGPPSAALQHHSFKLDYLGPH